VDEIFSVAHRENWAVKYCRRGGAFDVIEMWIEGCQMIEVLTPEMQREYLDAISIDDWNAMLEERQRAMLAEAA
jgi:hypothetical protein